jgi:hypothetical protein
MTVSKCLRYEVLRRDSYTCRYCGASAPTATLHVDHVTPRSQGGKDEPSNLITACEDCNLGKSSSMPDPWLVAEIERIAAQWEPSFDDNDDAFEVALYQQAYDFLEGLPAEVVLLSLARAFAAAAPYQPTLDEAIRAAASLAGWRVTEWPTLSGGAG